MDLHGAEVDAEARLEIGAGRVIERLSAAPNQLARAGGSPAWIGADVPRQRAERRRWCVARRVPRNGAGHPLRLSLGRVATLAHLDAAALRRAMRARAATGAWMRALRGGRWNAWASRVRCGGFLHR
jgi:hypothetical protein